MPASGDRPAAAFGWLGRLTLRNLHRLWIFLPVALLAVALAGYAWWWQVVAERLRASVFDLQAGQHALGREVKWDSFKVSGFPYSVEGTFLAAHLTAPDRGVAFDGERVVVRVQPFNLDTVALSLEGQQHFFHAREQWIEAKASAETSLLTLSGAQDDRRIEFDVARMTGQGKVDDKDFNFIVGGASGEVTVNGHGGRKKESLVALSVQLQNVMLKGNLDLALGPVISVFNLDATARIPEDGRAPPGGALSAAWQRAGTLIGVRRLELEWGGIMVGATGEFSLNEQLMPAGRLFLTLGNHQRVLELVRDAGWMKPDREQLARKVLDVLAFMSGDKQRRVSVPLRIENGEVYLGPAHIATLTPQPVMAQPIGTGPTAIP